MIEPIIDYITEDPIRTLVQIPALVLLIGGPIWLVRRIYKKNNIK